MIDPGRRRLLQGLAAAVALHGLLDRLLGARLLAAPAALTGWQRRLQERCADLRQGSLSVPAWGAEVERLLAEVPLPDLLALTDLERLAREMALPDLGVATRPIALPALTGLPEGAAFFAKVFGMGPDRAIIPHGHRHMVSCHMVLAGRFRLRQYDRLATDGDALILRAASDGEVGPGHAAAIGEHERNVHWFECRRGPGYTFDVIVTGLGGRYVIDNLDPTAARPLDGDRLRVPLLDVDSALARYGRGHHDMAGEPAAEEEPK